MKSVLGQISALLRQYLVESVLRLGRGVQDPRRRWQVVQRAAYFTVILVLLALFVTLFNRWQFERQLKQTVSTPSNLVVPQTAEIRNTAPTPPTEEMRQVEAPIIVRKAVQGRALVKPNLRQGEAAQLNKTLDAGNQQMSAQFKNADNNSGGE